MREILFRGKRIDSGEWVEGGYYVEKVGDYITAAFIVENLTNEVTEAHRVLPKTIGQYTGLCDKNGKRIFEGDILKARHEWHNWNHNFGNDEKDFLEQKIRNAYGKYIDKTLEDVCGWQYHYFRNYAVEYYTPRGGFRVRNGGQFHDLTRNYILNRNIEVIGNIHDNPELLKGGEG